jgi:large subunit ribosomal protein L24
MGRSKIKRGDTVVVTAGRDKGRVGKVILAIPAKDRVVVEGVNMVKRHQKPVGEQPGQIVNKEAAIHVSNVAFWSEAEQRRVKIGFKVLEDGTKVRVDRRTGANLDA